jgi:hypothetical protein
VAEVVEHRSRKREALSSNPSTAKKRRPKWKESWLERGGACDHGDHEHWRYKHHGKMTILQYNYRRINLNFEGKVSKFLGKSNLPSCLQKK